MSPARVSPWLWPRLEKRAALEPGQVGVRWLGVAGFVLRSDEHTIFLDPFVTRPPIPELLFGRLGADEAALARLPSPSTILLAHAHYDHAMDAAGIAKLSGATVYGSPTSCFVVEAMSPKARCVRVDGSTRVRDGPFLARAIRSEHAIAGNGRVPLPGSLALPLRGEHPHVTELLEGGVIAWIIEVSGLTILHLSSAGLPAPEALARELPRGVDVVLAAAPIRGADVAPYTKRIREELHPRLVIVHHHDPVFKRLTDPLPYRSRNSYQTIATELFPIRAISLPPFKESVLDEELR